LLQAAASTAAPGTGGSPYSQGPGGLPDLSGLLAGLSGGEAGGMGFSSPNFADMQRQVCQIL